MAEAVLFMRQLTEIVFWGMLIFTMLLGGLLVFQFLSNKLEESYERRNKYLIVLFDEDGDIESIHGEETQAEAEDTAKDLLNERFGFYTNKASAHVYLCDFKSDKIKRLVARFKGDGTEEIERAEELTNEEYKERCAGRSDCNGSSKR